MNVKISQLHFDEKGLVPAAVTDVHTKELLMLAYMNKTSLEESLKLGEAVFYSRSREELWHKGATSGNILRIVCINVDCNENSLQIEVEVQGDGVACHTGSRTCFFRPLLMS